MSRKRSQSTPADSVTPPEVSPATEEPLPGMPAPRRKRQAVRSAPDLRVADQRELEARALAIAEAMRLVRKPYFDTSWKELGVGLAIVVAVVAPLFPWLGVPAGIVSAALVGVWIRGGRLAAERLRREGFSASDDGLFSTRGQASPIVLTEKERAIQEQLKRSARELSRCYRLSWYAFAGTVAGAVVGGTICLSVYADALAGVLGFCFFVGISAVAAVTKRGDRAAKATAALLQKVGPQACGALVDFLRTTEPGLHLQALSALTGILPSLRASDGGALNADQRRYLYAMLEPEYARTRPALAEAVLAAIQQLADPEAEPYVQGLLAMWPIHSQRDRQLLRAGYLTLASLRQSEAGLTKRGTLLSPASAPVGEETLLHPVTAGGQPPEQLLRASVGEREEGE